MAKIKYLFRKNYANVITISKFFFLRYKCFFCNNMVAMVTIETPGFRPKRWLTLDKNFLFPSTMSLNYGKDQYLFRKNNANVITISNFAMSLIFSRFLWQIIIMKHQIRSTVTFKRFLRRFPSSSQIIQCVSMETPP